MLNFLKPFKKWHLAIIAHADRSAYPYMTFGIFGIITYPLYYLIWVYWAPIGYENLYLRLIAMFLCAFLIFVNYWPTNLKPFLPYYWYLTITYTLPFLFSFLLLKNNFSAGWALNAMTVIVLLILLIDLIPLILILLMGVALGYVCFQLNQPHTLISFPIDVMISYTSILIFGALFAHKKEQLKNEKLKTMQSLAGSIAHELRTPLSSIQAGVGGAKHYFLSLVNTYELAKRAGLSIEPIPKTHLQVLPRLFHNIELETEYSKSIINMILMNVKQHTIISSAFELCDMTCCIKKALERYPFKPSEKNLIHFQDKGGFIFRGNVTLMIHILFNLIKNALYFIEAEKKGEIQLSYGYNTKYNILYFQDTAKGISKSALLKLFSAFYSTTRHGTGLGLPFCKMAMTSFEGDIKCKSKINSYTRFEMYFPKISH